MSVFDPIGNFARLARHFLESAQDGDSAVFDLDQVAEAGAYAEDNDFRGSEEEASDLLCQDFAGLVVTEFSADELDIISSASDRFEERSCCYQSNEDETFHLESHVIRYKHRIKKVGLKSGAVTFKLSEAEESIAYLLTLLFCSVRSISNSKPPTPSAMH